MTGSGRWRHDDLSVFVGFNPVVEAGEDRVISESMPKRSIEGMKIALREGDFISLQDRAHERNLRERRFFLKPNEPRHLSQNKSGSCQRPLS